MIIQIILFLAVFAIMPLWKKAKINFAWSLIISALLISVVFGIEPAQIMQNFYHNDTVKRIGLVLVFDLRD